MLGEHRSNITDKYSDRHRRFLEVMEVVYGKEAGEMPVATLIARHRDVAEKLLGTKKAPFDPFVKGPDKVIQN